MWGQVSLFCKLIKSFRIIPTRVGTSLSTAADDYAQRDHPHACGDKPLCILLFCDRQGSSPRVWGQGRCDVVWRNSTGIIPTRVGTRSSDSDISTSTEDHPHACGDKLSKFVSTSPPTGSSPRVWGQVNGNVLSITGYRIIPTRVGTRCCVFSL